MISWGVSALNHDASIAVMDGQSILFAAHSERYSRIKNDTMLNADIVREAMKYGQPDEIFWFEKPLLKKTRYVRSGQWAELFEVSPKEHLKMLNVHARMEYVHHHESHAAAGYFTSGFEDAAVIVVDAIGEWDTISVWHARGNELKKIHSVRYPNSIGLFYSAVTEAVGLKPNEEEYILMGMAAYGDPSSPYVDMKKLIKSMEAPNFELAVNLHRGVSYDTKSHWNSWYKKEDLAASAQQIVETFMVNLVAWARKKIPSTNLVLMGGVALNCVANEKIARSGSFKNVWIMPNPGDAGSSIGAVLAAKKFQADWKHPYLGTNIEGELDPKEIVDYLIDNPIAAIANGRAEFGPRALGNRSLIADPRGPTIKNKVNDIKKRQRFRPFAPIILAEKAHEYFDMPVPESPYMQFTAPCKKPDLFPAICHVDDSSRVQTLTQEQNPVFHAILTEFYNRTGCPMLLNTSLNIKGEPLVNTWEDATRFHQKHGVKIF